MEVPKHTPAVGTIARALGRRDLIFPEVLQRQGACIGADRSLFYAEDGPAVAAAKLICESCPVIERCREWALWREEWGTWGALSARERAAWRRQQGVRLMSQAVIR